MVTINGKIVQGLGEASRTLTFQIPQIATVFPEIADCFVGSINVILDAQLEPLSPDFVTHPIKWCSNGPPEMFGFLRIEFEVPRAYIFTKAWIYIPYGSPHRLNPYYAEVITPKPQLDLQGQVECKIHLSPQRAKVVV
jgi:hypothetical protein